MNGKVVALLAIAAPLTAFAQKPDVQPASILRSLAAGVDPWGPLGNSLIEKPSILLDAIFLPEGNDTPPEESQRLARFWITRLNEENFHARQEASARLLDLGTNAIPTLKEATRSPHPEVRARANTAISHLQSTPMLADLDYSQVRQSVTAIASAITDPKTLESTIDSIFQRLGTPTVHNRESWILEPLIRQLVELQTPRAEPLISQALAHPHPRFAQYTANAIRDATTEIGLNPIFLVGITNQTPEVTSLVLDHAPSLHSDSPLAIPYLKTLNNLIARDDLHPIDVLKVHRLHVIAFQTEKSLAALVTASSAEDEASLNIIANTLTDPRLTALPLGSHPAIPTWTDHPNKRLRQAAGMFLITRPEPANQLASLPFLPHFDRETVEDLEPLIENLPNSSALSKALRAMITQEENGWEIAEDLLIALPPDILDFPNSPLPGFHFE